MVQLNIENGSCIECLTTVTEVKDTDGFHLDTLYSSFNGFYGEARFVKFTVEQEDGTVVELVTLGTSKHLYSMTEGVRYLIKATVKEHTEVNGVPQTIINQVEILKEME